MRLTGPLHAAAEIATNFSQMMAKIIQIHVVSDSNEDRIYALADDGTLWVCHQEGSHRLIWKQIEPPPFGDASAQETVPPQI